MNTKRTHTWKRSLISLLLAWGAASGIQAQQNIGCMNLSPEFPQISSPEAAAFNKYIDHPVSSYNGTPEIAVPLFNLQDGEINLPFALRYNASGIKVAEEASCVGLGWNLNMGGMIVMSRVGGDDKMDSEYNTTIERMAAKGDLTYYNQLFYHSHMNSLFTAEHLWNMTNHLGKFNPDVYTYTYPGGGGKFVYDYRDNHIMILNREENIQIVEEMDGNFSITLPDGTVHRYARKGGVHCQYPSQTEARYFCLTETEYPNGQKVSYTYNSYPVDIHSPYAYFQTNYDTSSGNWGYYDYESYTNSIGSELYLSDITTPHYQVSFSMTDREDIKDGKKLSEISITSSDNAAFSKKFCFEYSYFDSGNFDKNWMFTNDNTARKRLRLDAVSERSGNLERDRYEFFYNGTPPPQVHLCHRLLGILQREE